MDLVECLGALASAPRLQIIRQLRRPVALRDIHVSGERPDAGPTIARQTVRRHVERLVEVGVAQRVGLESEGSEFQFVVDHQRLFLLSEEVRALARLRPTLEGDAQTIDFDAPAAVIERGPRLVLVRGLDEGEVFPLSAPHHTWRVGRRRGLEISLDYDPSVSTENAVIERSGASLVISDVEGSRNGTLVNFRRLVVGEKRKLAHGDLISIGRSLLLYWA